MALQKRHDLANDFLVSPTCGDPVSTLGSDTLDLKQLLRRMLDEIAGEMIDDAARADNVHVHYEEEIRELVRSNGSITKLITKNGMEIPADCVGVGLGLGLGLGVGTGSE